MKTKALNQFALRLRVRATIGLFALHLVSAQSGAALAHGIPTLVGELGSGPAYSITINGHYAYVGNGGLQIFDISDAVHPVMLSYMNDGGTAQSIAISGNYAYVANGLDGLRIYGISDPLNPVNVGHINDGGIVDNAQIGFAASVAVSSNYVYLANENDGLRIYDVSDPTNPIGIGHTNDTNDAGITALGVAVTGHYVYLANGDDGLRIYDVSDPTRPENVAHIDLPSRRVVISDHCAYVVSTNGLQIYDVSIPGKPTAIGLARPPLGASSIVDVAVLGRYAFAALRTQGVAVYYVPSQGDPLFITSVFQPETMGVAASANHVYSISEDVFIYTLQSTQPPLLTLAAASPDTIQLSWPSISADFSLQQSRYVDAGWMPVTNAASEVQGQVQVILHVTPDTHFFRLIR